MVITSRVGFQGSLHNSSTGLISFDINYLPFCKYRVSKPNLEVKEKTYLTVGPAKPPVIPSRRTTWKDMLFFIIVGSVLRKKKKLPDNKTSKRATKIKTLIPNVFRIKKKVTQHDHAETTFFYLSLHTHSSCDVFYSVTIQTLTNNERDRVRS